MESDREEDHSEEDRPLSYGQRENSSHRHTPSEAASDAFSESACETAYV